MSDLINMNMLAPFSSKRDHKTPAPSSLSFLHRAQAAPRQTNKLVFTLFD